MSKLSPLAFSEYKSFSKVSLVRGKPAVVECVEISGQTYVLGRGALTVLSLEDDWFEDVKDPRALVETLKRCNGNRPDIFTFWQRLPHVEPRYSFHTEWEELAVLPINNYEYWWNHQIKSRVRNQLRKAERDGLVVKEAAYDDDFVRGMTAIFNETPVRQGRKFWHYGKDFQAVKSQFSRYIHREDLVGAYYNGEMIGFLMMGNAESYGVTAQVISSVKHRGRSVNNALIAKAVELCERKGLAYLVYLYWGDDTLAEFKRRCGFEKTQVPRYFVPLTMKGRAALSLGVHRSWRYIVPKQLKTPLKKLRSAWFGAGRAE